MANVKYVWTTYGLLGFNMIITCSTLTIINPSLLNWSENVDIKMQVRDRHVNERRIVKQLHDVILPFKKEVAVFSGPCLESLS